VNANSIAKSIGTQLPFYSIQIKFFFGVHSIAFTTTKLRKKGERTIGEVLSISSFRFHLFFFVSEREFKGCIAFGRIG